MKDIGTEEGKKGFLKELEQSAGIPLWSRSQNFHGTKACKHQWSIFPMQSPDPTNIYVLYYLGDEEL